MRHRTLDEMIAYFNRQVSDMDIKREYKIQLLGMITAIGYEASAQPERKKGKWIQSEEKEGMEFTFYEIHCSECGVLRKIGWTGANFCPNCGADMRGEGHETD